MFISAKKLCSIKKGQVDKEVLYVKCFKGLKLF